jgi:hypothetical protein
MDMGDVSLAGLGRDLKSVTRRLWRVDETSIVRRNKLLEHLNTAARLEVSPSKRDNFVIVDSALRAMARRIPGRHGER